MILHSLLATLLFLFQTPVVATPETEETNVFLDLGSEHCATEIAFAAYERAVDEELGRNVNPEYITYSAFAFESGDQAQAALEDAPVLVAQTFSDDPNITERENFEDIVTEVDTEPYGDAATAYVMTLPVDDGELDVLTVELLGIVKNQQMLLILMFSETGTTRPGPGLTLETLPPFGEQVNEDWDGTGDLQEAIPAQEEMPVGWEGREVTVEDPPSC